MHWIAPPGKDTDMHLLGPHKEGFDAAVNGREDDHLNRWPFAREISTIACSGPKDWSVRIGVYGEWGTGKTSVLRFVASMGKKNDHVVVWFDPWEYSSKSDLWQSFVLKVFDGLENKLGGIAQAGDARRKNFFKKLTTGIKPIGAAAAGALSDHAGDVAKSGLELLRQRMTFGPDDLKELGDLLGDRRVIILIDDLDRTAAELVPEILFALKELMDIPRFSFVCAFDPIVVGKVLRQHHRGFGDGLKFLEKIIDYPRWLPPPPPEGLAKLAVADAKRYCDYVPEEPLRNAIKLLPQNPRLVRQFIRQLALVGPQIKRHDEDELRWSVILAANVIKVRHPHLAHALLNDIDFWSRIESVTILDRSEEKAKLTEVVTKQVEAVDTSQNAHLDASEKTGIVRALMLLCSDISLWFGGGAKVQVYQMNVGEAPHAVTGKEFNGFCAAWDRDSSASNAKTWIASHADKVERPTIDVYHELLGAALDRYPKTLRAADSVRREEERPPLLKQANALIEMVECLVLELGRIESPDKQIGPAQIEQLFEAVTTILKSSHAPGGEFCTRNETLLINVIKRWQGDVTPLTADIVPYGYWGSGRFDGPNASALHQRLSQAVLPKLAAQVIAGLRQPGYLQRIWPQDRDSLQIRCLLYTLDGPLWKDARKELLIAFQEAATNQAVQENAYEILHWFEHILGERGETGDANALKKVILEKSLLDAVWSAATAKPLSPYAAAGLNQFVLRLKPIGASVELPTWWADAMERSGYKPKPEANTGAGASGNETGQTT